jgi:transcriptional regulator with XRE-family HTH domain
MKKTSKGETFGQTVRRLREERDMARRDLEDLTGVSVKTISNIENERPEGLNPTKNTVEALAQALGPQVMVAAFPTLVILAARSKERASARKLGLPDWGMAPQPGELASVGG